MPSSRSLAFSNSLRLGICFAHLKEKIIRQGDLTSRVGHPWFIWFMAMTGVHLHQESRHDWRELRIQRMLTQMLFFMLLEMRATGPPFDIFQAWYLMAMSSTYSHTTIPAQRYLLRCQELIKSEDFRLVEPTEVEASTRPPPFTAVIGDRPPEYNDEKHELVSLLVNLIYLQCIHCLLYDACHGMYADLEAQLPDFAVRFLRLHHSEPIPQPPFLSGFIRRLSIPLPLYLELAPSSWFGTCFCISICWRKQVCTPSKIIVVDAHSRSIGLSQKVWLADAANLLSRLDVILQVLDSAANQLNDTGTLLPVEAHEKRHTYLLMSSCKLFCATARARIYMEISKLPIVPRVRSDEFRNLAMESVQDFLLIYKAFDRENDLRHLDYFVVVSRNGGFSMRFSIWLTIITAMLVSYSRPPPGPLPWRLRPVSGHGGLSANYPVGGHVESYARG